MQTQTPTPVTDRQPPPPTTTTSLELIGPALEAIATAVIVTDPGLTIRYLNTAALDLLRDLEAALPWSASEAIGKSFALLCREPALRDRSRLPLSLSLALASGDTLELHAGPYYDHHGDYVGPILGLTRATARAELEERLRDFSGQVEAIEASQAVVEFAMDGVIRRVNAKFLALVGYTAEQVLGRHHRMFVTDAAQGSTEYEQFWASLRRGEVQQGEFMRVDKHGSEVWLRASYTPIRDETGQPYKIVKYATDVTEDKRRALDAQAQMTAIDRAMATAEFDLDGTIRSANRNFLDLMGYEIDEIRGRHHRLFVAEDYGRSDEYHRFWRALADGEFQQAEFLRYAKGGEEIWIQASYNPVFDFEGRPIKVVKYATDITAQRRQREQIQHLSAEAERRAEQLQAQVAVMLEVVNAAANGDLTQAVELGEDEGAMIEMGAGLDRLIGDLRSSIASISDHANEVGVASSQLTSVSEQMAATADETSAQVQLVSDAAEDVSSNVATVATGIEELGASMREIADSATEAAKIATRAVGVAHTTNDAVSRLGESSVEIGKIVKLITSIAQQTNLLALNATIEAARAGEAGRGFAVVANEVKELAKETASATDEISTKIEGIQKSTGNAVEAIEEIGRIINQINEYQGAIAAAVEQQSSTTAAISRNVSEAARGSKDIAQSITSVSVAARDTSGAATDTQKAAVQLRGMAGALQGMVGRFTI